jgi:hypothetical protein
MRVPMAVCERDREARDAAAAVPPVIEAAVASLADGNAVARRVSRRLYACSDAAGRPQWVLLPAVGKEHR